MRMAGLKINLDDLESDSDDPTRIYYEGLRLGKLTVSSEGLMTSMGYKYGLSPEDVVVNSVSFLGRGSSGSVRRATYRKTGKALALKEIKVTGRAHLQEIRRELETLHGDDSTFPHLVDFYGAFFHEGSVFIGMECMDGSLDDVKKPVPTGVLVSITRSILRGLLYLHKTRHLIHRDLKPSNLLYNRDGSIKISDFGVSSFLECTRGDAYSFVGTLTYMSPERLKGEPYSFSADIWSLGLVIAELAIGSCPFMDRLTRNGTSTETCFWVLLQHVCSDGPVISLPSSMNQSLAEFILICIQKDAQKRPGCEELLNHPFITMKGESDDRCVIRKWLSTVSETGEGAVTAAGEGPLNLDEELDKLLQ